MADATDVHAVVLACGGTGGHVYPAIAIAREIARRAPHVRLSFVGRPASYEAEVIAREGFELDPMSVGRLVGQGPLTMIRTLGGVARAVAQAARILARREADVVVGTGGFVSGPAVLAAAWRRLPVVIQEQNAALGLTNRIASRLADRVALAHPREGAKGPRCRVTGNPVRPEFFAIAAPAPRTPFTVLVLGGSQGARSLNEATCEAAARLGDLAGKLRIVLQCGPRWERDCRERLAQVALDVEVAPYVHDVPQRLAQASFVISRAGASTVAELCAAGRAALLVPFPHAAGDHQTLNAQALQAAGAAEMQADADVTGEFVARRLRAVVADPAPLALLAARARALARPDAAARIVDLVFDVARRRPIPRVAPLSGTLP